jgi:hypothetical protein
LQRPAAVVGSARSSAAWGHRQPDVIANPAVTVKPGVTVNPGVTVDPEVAVNPGIAVNPAGPLQTWRIGGD